MDFKSVGLKVGLFYGGKQNAVLSQQENFDVILTTMGTKCLFKHHFHRRIVDECHQGSYGEWMRTYSDYSWCVSGTPFSSSLSDLQRSASFLGHWMMGSDIRQYCDSKVRHLAKQNVVLVLRSLMIRHTKSQRIGGEIALALPDSSTETVSLTMNSTERDHYTRADLWTYYYGRILSTFAVEMRLGNRRQVAANCGSMALLPTEQKTKLSFLIQGIL